MRVYHRSERHNDLVQLINLDDRDVHMINEMVLLVNVLLCHDELVHVQQLMDGLFHDDLNQDDLNQDDLFQDVLLHDVLQQEQLFKNKK